MERLKLQEANFDLKTWKFFHMCIGSVYAFRDMTDQCDFNDTLGIYISDTKVKLEEKKS